MVLLLNAFRWVRQEEGTHCLSLPKIPLRRTRTTYVTYFIGVLVIFRIERSSASTSWIQDIVSLASLLFSPHSKRDSFISSSLACFMFADSPRLQQQTRLLLKQCVQNTLLVGLEHGLVKWYKVARVGTPIVYIELDLDLPAVVQQFLKCLLLVTAQKGHHLGR